MTQQAGTGEACSMGEAAESWTSAVGTKMEYFHILPRAQLTRQLSSLKLET